MSIYKTEEEQIDDLKRWTKSYGPSILIGIVLAIALIYGWRYWKSYQHTQATQASALYQEAVNAYEMKQYDLLDKTISILQNKYHHSPYVFYAVFIKAKASVDRQNFDTATTSLDWIMHNASDDNIKSIAALRLASVQTANHHETAAIETLQAITNPAFKGLALIKTADAYLALGDFDNAKTNYEKANKLLPNAGNVMPTLAIKLADSSVI